MCFLKKIILTILVWIGLLVVLFVYLKAFKTNQPLDKPAVLFIFYTVFSWSIALLAFVMESARQQLFRQTSPFRSALRLGLYGSFAVVLALLTSPKLNTASANEVLAITVLAYGYCYLAGLSYGFFSRQATKPVH